MNARRIDIILDAVNFFLADLRGGLGPYVGVFLLTQAHWTAVEIGSVLTISGILGTLAQAPIGALIDATRAKRALLVTGVIVLSASAIAIAQAPTALVVLAADILMAILGAIFAPTVAAITLGVVESTELAARLGRNAALDRIGNIFIAGLAGLVGWEFSQYAIFYLLPVFAFFSAAAVLSIPSYAIDHERARGLGDNAAANTPAPLSRLAFDRPLLILGGTLALFHFANASMLPILAQMLALSYPMWATLIITGCIMAAQFATIPAAALVALKADQLGRKPLLIACCAALPLRGLLLAAIHDPFALICVQVLDGFGAGLFDTLLPLVLADVVRGTGRYNLSRGLLGMVQGVGGSLSNGFSGAVIVAEGYGAAFAALSLFALAALGLAALALPETRPSDSASS